MNKFIKGWNSDMSLEDTKNLAYFERNMLALMYAVMLNDLAIEFGYKTSCGWYYDTDNNWDGWKRVISLNDGECSFHIPDNFDVGRLKQIEPNWDNHTTEEKWLRVMDMCGVTVDETINPDSTQ